MNDADAPSRVGLAVGFAIGAPMMLFGIAALIQHTDSTSLGSFLRFFLGGNIVHDAIAAPIAGVVGLLVIRRLPNVARAPVRAALFGTVTAVAVAWPALRGYGRMRRARQPHRPAAQLRDGSGHSRRSRLDPQRGVAGHSRRAAASARKFVATLESHHLTSAWYGPDRDTFPVAKRWTCASAASVWSA